MDQSSGQHRTSEFAAEIEIRPISPQDMDAVCEVIGLAFTDNPSTLANVRGDRAKARRTMQDAVRVAKFGRPWSHALVALQGTMVVGALNAAAWPHCQMGIAAKIKTAPSMLRIMNTALPRAFTMMAKRQAPTLVSPTGTSAPSACDPNGRAVVWERRS